MGGARSKDFAYSMNIRGGGGSLHTVTVVQPLHWSRNISLHLPTSTLSFSPTTSPLLSLISSWSSVLVQRVRVQVAIDWIRSHAIHFMQQSIIAIHDFALRLRWSQSHQFYSTYWISLHKCEFLYQWNPHVHKYWNCIHVNMSYIYIITINFYTIFLLSSWILIKVFYLYFLILKYSLHVKKIA